MRDYYAVVANNVRKRIPGIYLAISAGAGMNASRSIAVGALERGSGETC